MATPRKRWFKVADKLGADATPNDVLAFFLRLSAHLNTRWARDGLSAEEACRCMLSPGQLAHIAGSRTRVRCESTASAFATRFEATVTKLDGFYTVHWPKFADFQGLTPDCGATVGQLSARESPPPRSASASSSSDQKKTQNPEAPAEPGAPPAEPIAPDPEVAAKGAPWGPLANLLGAYGTDPPPAADERREWLSRFWPEVEAAAEAELPDGATDRQRAASQKRIALARWRTYLGGDRPLRDFDARQRELARLAAFRDAVFSRPAPEIEPDGDETALRIIGNDGSGSRNGRSTGATGTGLAKQGVV